MRLPARKSEKWRNMSQDDGPLYLTPEGKRKIENRLKNNKEEISNATLEVRRTAEMGDLSENAAYQIAKQHLRRLQTKIVLDEELLKRVVIIEPLSCDLVQLGSRVTIEKDGVIFKYHIVGPYEADPKSGRISCDSPFGQCLIGKKVGQFFTFQHDGQEKKYFLKKIEL